MILQTILAFIATVAFSILFNVPRSQLLCGGLVGTAGWLVYQLVMVCGFSLVTCTFAASITISVLSRSLSVRRKVPITLFLIPGIIPLVPGAGVYDTMYYAITGELLEALFRGIETFKIAGIISVGIIIVLSAYQLTGRLAESRRNAKTGKSHAGQN